ASSTKTDGVKYLDRIWHHLDEEQQKRCHSSISYSGENLDEMLEWIDANVKSSIMHGEMMVDALGSIESSAPHRIADILARLDVDFTHPSMDSSVKEASRSWAELDPDGL